MLRIIIAISTIMAASITPALADFLWDSSDSWHPVMPKSYKPTRNPPPNDIARTSFRGHEYRAYRNGGIFRFTGAGDPGERVYSGGQYAKAMITCRNSIFTAFSRGNIYRSPDGNNLGGGGRTRRVYGGNQTVVNMRCSGDDVITTFSGGGTYRSPDGNNLGGGGNTVRI